MIVPKLCEVLGITINELFDVEDVIQIEGVIEYDQSQLTKYRTVFLKSLLILLTPITILLGVLLQSSLIFYIFIIFTVLSYMYSLIHMCTSSINFYKYIQNNYYSTKYKQTLKNYLIIYGTTLFALGNFGLFFLSQNTTKVILVVIFSLIFNILILFFVRSLKYSYKIKNKLGSFFSALSIYVVGVILGVLDIYVLGDLFILIILVSTWVFVLSLLKLKERV